MLDELFRRLGIESGYFVEIGAHDGDENCTHHLLVNRNWKGTWVEGDADRVARARVDFSNHAVKVVQEVVTKENALDLVDREVPERSIDLLVIDVDGNDYWLFNRLVPAVRPGVVVVEYNSWFGPHSWWVMPYDPLYTWDETARHGASIAPLHYLAKKFGYELVAGEQSGANLFFVRADLAQRARPPLPAESPADAYHVLKHHIFGHPPVRPPACPNMEALPLEEAGTISLRFDHLYTRPPIVVGEPIFLTLVIANSSNRWLHSESNHPVHIAYRWLAADGQIVVQEGARTPLTWPIPPRSRRVLPARVHTPECSGDYALRMTLVQEGVRWFDDLPLGAYVDTPLSVGSAQ